MKVIIDIDDNLYYGIVNNKYGVYTGRIFDIISNGTPLPKGHRLIDADILDEVKEIVTTDTGDYKYAVLMDNIRLIPTIIEADKAESEEENNG